MAAVLRTKKDKLMWAERLARAVADPSPWALRQNLRYRLERLAHRRKPKESPDA